MRIANLAQTLLIRDQTLETQSRLQTVEQQIASGYKSQVFSGLGGDSKKLLDFDQAKSSLGTYVESIMAAERRSKVMDSAMLQISDIAKDMRADNIATFSYTNDSSVRQNILTRAEEAIGTTVSALNAQFEGRFLFSGYEFATKPVDDTAATIIADATAVLVANGFPAGTVPTTPADIEAAVDEYLGIAPAGPAGYYQSGSSDQLAVRIDANQELTYGVTADDDAFRTVLKGYLMTSLSVSRYDDLEATAQGSFDTAYENARTVIEQGGNAVNGTVGQLGIRRQKMEMTRLDHEATIDILTQSISEIQDADVYEAITELQRLQVQLQGSYQVTAQLADLSLVNFI